MGYNKKELSASVLRMYIVLCTLQFHQWGSLAAIFQLELCDLCDTQRCFLSLTYYLVQRLNWSPTS